MKRILLLVVTISLFGYVMAQEDIWEVFLRGQAVKSIDFENNYVWAATDNFLIRLNKIDKNTTYYLYPYTDVNGSSYNLKIDKNGVKWFARSENLPSGGSIYKSYNSSIYSFDGTQWQIIKSLGYGLIYSLAVDKNNCIWIAKMGESGLFKIEPDSCVQYTPENSGLVYNRVAQVASDKYGNIWLYNYGNLHELIRADVSLIKYDGDNWISNFSGGGFQIANINIDSQGNPWVQQFFFLQKLDTVSNSWSEKIDLSQDNPYQLRAIKGENEFWFKSNKDNGIALYNGSDWFYYTASNSGLLSNVIYDIQIDSDGTKWIGTANGLVSLKLTTLSTRISKLDKEIELFPNPANDFIILKMPGEIQKSRVDILNMQGKVMKSLNLSNDQNRLDVSQFPEGIYLVRIQSEGNQMVKKFVKH